MRHAMEKNKAEIETGEKRIEYCYLKSDGQENSSKNPYISVDS